MLASLMFNRVPPGPWAVGVSGGADSVCLLALLRDRAVAHGDLALHVVHLDHQTRDGESAADAAFVQELAARWQLPCTVADRAAVEATMPAVPANPSARYRAARLTLFRQVIACQRLQGVVLAHHAADQTETIFQRVVRGSGFAGLAGMASETTVAGVRVLRPLLGAEPGTLRIWLAARDIRWREDASNVSPTYQRNRVRRLLAGRPDLADMLRSLGSACAALRDWTEAHAPRLAERFAAADLRDCPDVLASHAARRWLTARGAVADDIGPAAVARLIGMARDAAAPARRHFPGRLLVRRRGGILWAERS